MRSPCTATKSSPRSPQLEKAGVQQWRPNTAKKKKRISISRKINARALNRKTIPEILFLNQFKVGALSSYMEVLTSILFSVIFFFILLTRATGEIIEMY